MIIIRVIGVLAGTLVALTPGPALAADQPPADSARLYGPVREAVEGAVHEPLEGHLADTGGVAERLWLLGGVALALTGAGVVALAATRGRR
ncbi:hypothetical protein [Streptomyces odonnellii]|uniref:hypothetical protein n=1 Tax=Streptomyces odonnellii TaxID=1417980 RepID=UPI000626AE15|nr:hypothetical protein [Streptomyces odonnellii]